MLFGCFLIGVLAIRFATPDAQVLDISLALTALLCPAVVVLAEALTLQPCSTPCPFEINLLISNTAGLIEIKISLAHHPEQTLLQIL